MQKNRDYYCPQPTFYLLFFLMLTLLRPPKPQTPQAHFCFRVFVLAVPSAWKVLPLDIHVALPPSHGPVFVLISTSQGGSP